MYIKKTEAGVFGLLEKKNGEEEFYQSEGNLDINNGITLRNRADISRQRDSELLNEFKQEMITDQIEAKLNSNKLKIIFFYELHSSIANSLQINTISEIDTCTCRPIKSTLCPI